MSEESPIDLTPIRQAQGEAKWESLARRIEAAAEPELRRRAAPTAIVVPLSEALLRQGRWLIAASVVLAAVSTGALFLARRPESDLRVAVLSAFTGVPDEAAGVFLSETPPRLSQFIGPGETR